MVLAQNKVCKTRTWYEPTGLQPVLKDQMGVCKNQESPMLQSSDEGSCLFGSPLGAPEFGPQPFQGSSSP